MRHIRCGSLAVGVLLAAIAMTAVADDARDEAIKKDRKRIEGKWNIVALEVNGNKAQDQDARKLSVVNGSDGTWRLLSEGNEVSRGTSTIDPTKSPRTIDLSTTDEGGNVTVHLGIYELGETTRKLCFAAPGKERPTEFKTTPDSETILVLFERDKEDSIKRDRKRCEGVWKGAAVEIDGNVATAEDSAKITLVIGADGSWSLNSEGKEVGQGTTTIDPTSPPKTIDFTVTAGDDVGKQFLAIYEVGETSLKICAAPAARDRPGDFTSTAGSERIVLSLERMNAK